MVSYISHLHVYLRRLTFNAVVLALATLCIFIRSVFRVAELSDGFSGDLANNEVSFMVLDGTMVVIACIAFTVVHPGVAFGKVWHEANFHFRTKKSEGASDTENPGFRADKEKNQGAVGESEV